MTNEVLLEEKTLVDGANALDHLSPVFRDAGFTGTSQGMTLPQLRAYKELLAQRAVHYLHHGDCEGADEQAHRAALKLGVQPVVHPPLDPKKRAFCNAPPVFVRDPKPYLARNRDVVDESDELHAAPKEYEEPTRTRAGGTWYTVRYARQRGRRIFIVWPTGVVTEEARVGEEEAPHGED